MVSWDLTHVVAQTMWQATVLVEVPNLFAPLAMVLAMTFLDYLLGVFPSRSGTIRDGVGNAHTEG